MDILSKVIKLFFGSKADKDRKEIIPYVEKIKAIYPSIAKLSNDELRARSAALSKAERCQLLQESMSALHPYLLNFLKILTEKGYMRRFADCQSTYQQCYYRDNNMLPVSAVTAIALSAQQSEKLQARLSELTGKTVLLSNKVDTSLLGGIRLDYDGKQIDDTIAHRLDSVRQLLKNTVL